MEGVMAVYRSATVEGDGECPVRFDWSDAGFLGIEQFSFDRKIGMRIRLAPRQVEALRAWLAEMKRKENVT